MICCSRSHPVHPSASSILPCSSPSASPALCDCLRYLKPPRHCGGFCRVHLGARKETWVLGWTGSCRMEVLACFDVSEFCSFPEAAMQTNALQSAVAASPKDRPHPLQGLSQLPKHSHLLPSVTALHSWQKSFLHAAFCWCVLQDLPEATGAAVLGRESYGEVAESHQSHRVGYLSRFLSKSCSGTKKPKMPQCRLEDQKLSPLGLMGVVGGWKPFVLDPWKVSWIWWELSCWFSPSKG